jgi:benzoyl-CoA-dihydrodiol lyase
MVDDRSSTVSLPEVPLLGVLPGTGGLTRVTDKRKVRRDLADIFCTTSEGVRADRAKDWKLIDAHAKPQQFGALVDKKWPRCAASPTRNGPAGHRLTPLEPAIDEQGYHYGLVDVQIDRAARVATLTVQRAAAAIESTPEAIVAAGVQLVAAQAGPRAGRRDPEPAHQRAGDRHLGDPDPRRCQPGDARRRRAGARQEHWLVRETTGMLRRTLARSTSPAAR